MLPGVKALTVDTGGTVLDWHTGFRSAFAKVGERHKLKRDWGKLANELRRRTMAAMLNLGKDVPPGHNFDEAHRFCLDALLAEGGLDAFDETDRHSIAWEAPHAFKAWPDVRRKLSSLRARYIVASFTLLSYRLVIDSSRQNDITWDAVLSCEGIGMYKLLPEAYHRASQLLQLDPAECLMVACHPYDLDAAKSVGFRTALTRRKNEWGDDPNERPALLVAGTYDVEVDNFLELATALGAG